MRKKIDISNESLIAGLKEIQHGLGIIIRLLQTGHSPPQRRILDKNELQERLKDY